MQHENQTAKQLIEERLLPPFLCLRVQATVSVVLSASIPIPCFSPRCPVPHVL